MFSEHDPEANIEQHGKIHSSSRTPHEGLGEARFRRLTVRMKPRYRDRDRLHHWARVDYTKLFVVNYDVESVSPTPIS